MASIAAAKSPSDFLKFIVGKSVIIKLNTGASYRGVLACLDGFFNIAMEQTEECDTAGQVISTLGDCFFRGNNVLYIGIEGSSQAASGKAI